MNTIPRLAHAIGVLALCASTWACGQDSPTTPSNTNVTGTWIGTALVPERNSQLRLTFSHTTGSEISGTWAWSVDDVNGGGPLGGVVNGDSVSLTLSPSNPADQCRINITATVSGSRMTGTYGGFTCPVNMGGAVDLTRQ